MQRLEEQLSEKLRFWSMIPWKLMGIYQCEQNGPVEVSQRIARECMAEYDSAVASGKHDLLHRVSHRLLAPGTPYRNDLQAFSEGGPRPLSDFPAAHNELRAYALAQLAERKIERMHARVHTFGKHAPRAAPVHVAAKLRESDNLGALSKFHPFHEFCLRHWGDKMLARKVLQGLIPEAELQRFVLVGARIYRTGPGQSATQGSRTSSTLSSDHPPLLPATPR